MDARDPRPLVGVPACRKDIDGHAYHAVGDKYVRALAVSAGALPLIIPALPELVEAPGLVARLDGLLLTGSPSNVHPEHYGRAAHAKAEPHDPARDATTLPLIGEAIARGLPLFAICRGMQELNVALGGTLHAPLHEAPGRFDHRRPDDADHDVQYGPRHAARLAPGGLLAALLERTEIEINSLHGQGIEALAPDLRVEATAADGTVEAVSLPDAPGFVLGVQWHPEYKSWESPVSGRLFEAFGAAARERAATVRASRGPGMTGLQADAPGAD